MKKFKEVSSVFLGLILSVLLIGCASDFQNIKIDDHVVPQKVENQEQQVTYNVQIALYDADKNLKDYREYHNIVTTAGKNDVRKQITGAAGGGAQPAKFNYTAIGTGTNAEAIGDTALQTECGTRVQDTDPDFPADGQTRLITTFGAGNCTGAVTESGVLNALTSGTLLCRKTFSVINKASGDSLQITWTISAN